MNSSKPIVRAGQLFLPNEPLLPPINLDSAWWFKWLDESKTKTFNYESGIGSFNARKEKRTTSRKQYWSAYKRISGKLRKVYIGTSDHLTSQHLEEIARDINQDDATYWSSRKKYVADKEKHQSPSSYPIENSSDCVTHQSGVDAVTQESCIALRAELEDLQRQLADAEILARKAQAQLDQERSQLKKLMDLVNSKTKGYTDNSAAQLISAFRKLASSDLSVAQPSQQAASQDNLSN